MLTELRIAGLGVIDEAVVDFGPGFTVVTGETGAGKTMVVTGLSLLLGARAEPRIIRQGAERALVEGRLSGLDSALLAQVEDLGGELDSGELLVARQVSNTRSRYFVGGAQVPVGAGAEALADALTVHGQSEQVRLASADRQRDILDRFAGRGVAAKIAQYRTDFAQWRALTSELATLTEESGARLRERELLVFGLTEIERIDPQPDEDVALAAESERLQAVDDLRTSARTALVAIAGDDEVPEEVANARALVAQARRAASAAADRDPLAAPIAEALTAVGYALADASAELASYLVGLEADPVRLEWIASRRAELQVLTRKYGPSCTAVLAWAREAAERVTLLTASDDRIDILTEQTARLEAALWNQARQISAARREAADVLAGLVQTELAALAMPQARMSFVVEPGERLGPLGIDSVSMLFAANPGSVPGPLGKIASGGELSRVRLALEVVLAADSDGQTFVFDEVDAGVGGAVGLEIGRRLARLATHAQVIVVTHLAQVAAFADRHYVVVKANDGQVTTSGITEVDGAARVAELARMMAGLESTDSALAHARELLAAARR